MIRFPINCKLGLVTIHQFDCPNHPIINFTSWLVSSLILTDVFYRRMPWNVCDWTWSHMLSDFCWRRLCCDWHTRVTWHNHTTATQQPITTQHWHCLWRCIKRGKSLWFIRSRLKRLGQIAVCLLIKLIWDSYTEIITTVKTKCTNSWQYAKYTVSNWYYNSNVIEKSVLRTVLSVIVHSVPNSKATHGRGTLHTPDPTL